ncbi:MAG: N-acetylmannosamine-6-phosphate 2-epimerase [Clostridiales bacterium 38-18]|nr:MAG: N-acetylmannosamine-6-phosphate 2-epimerase [Clostridiales bacterium 38-18]
MIAFKGKLIVSCQALPDEPLHSSFIMGRMALAAFQGGAAGIRANSIEDINAIKGTVNLPIIGLIKRDYPDAQVYITPTIREIDELVAASVAIIATDATRSTRPEQQLLKDFFNEVKIKYPDQKFMADCSTIEEALEAELLGFDYVSTTLLGYTPYTQGKRIEDNDFEFVKRLVAQLKIPVIAEGNIDTPEKARRALELGCYSVVVGAAITRPQLITQRFVSEIMKK